jgi:hypothetical protein
MQANDAFQNVRRRFLATHTASIGKYDLHYRRNCIGRLSGRIISDGKFPLQASISDPRSDPQRAWSYATWVVLGVRHKFVSR